MWIEDGDVVQMPGWPKKPCMMVVATIGSRPEGLRQLIGEGYSSIGTSTPTCTATGV
jgi:hypothetical protein